MIGDDDLMPEIVRKAREQGSSDDEAEYIEASGLLRQCNSCGSARKYCSCGRPLMGKNKVG